MKLRISFAVAVAIICSGIALCNINAQGQELSSEADAPTAVLEGRWETIPLPEGKFGYDGSSDVGVDSTGMIWVCQRGQKLFYRDGSQFQRLVLKDRYGPKLFGDATRGLYLMVRNNSLNNSPLEIYQLAGKEPQFMGRIITPPSSGGIRPYASRSGQIFLWSEKFLAVLDNGNWQQMDVNFQNPLLTSFPIIIDNDTRTFVLGDQQVYFVDNDGKLTAANLSLPLYTSRGGFQRAKGVALGDSKLLVMDGTMTSWFVYDMETLTLVPGHDLNTKIVRRAQDMTRMPDGSVLIRREPVRQGEAEANLLIITPDMEVKPLPASERIFCDDAPFNLSAGPLIASDGAIWLSLAPTHVGCYKNGKLCSFDWSNGYNGGIVRRIIEDPDGAIYVLGFGGLCRFYPGEVQPPLPASMNEWEKVQLLVRPFLGRAHQIWGFWEDQPGKVSLWDGQQWIHVAVPFDHRFQPYRDSCVDNRGHLLVRVPKNRDKGAPETYFDVSADGAIQQPTWEVLLEKAAAAGMTYAENRTIGTRILVTADGRIFAKIGWNERCFFDGKEWKPLDIEQVATFCESKKYGVLLRDSNSRYFTQQEDELKLVADRSTPGGLWMFGPSGVQPFEAAMVAAHPETYLPLAQYGPHKFYVSTVSVAMPANQSPPSDAIPVPDETSASGAVGGYWLCVGARFYTQRFLGTQIFEGDLTETPINGILINEFIEDSAHNLWCLPSSLNGPTILYMRKAPKIALSVLDMPEQIKGHAEITIRKEPALGAPKDIRLFWRLPGGAWQGGERTSTVTVDFPKAGDYTIEVIAMDPLGCTPMDSLTFNVHADGPE